MISSDTIHLTGRIRVDQNVIAISLSAIDYYIGSAEGHEYPDLQVGDEVNPRRFLR